DSLLAVEEEPVRPKRRLSVELTGFQPILSVEAEVEVGNRPLLGLPTPVEVHVARHVLDPTIDEGQDVVDPDLAQLLEASPADTFEVDRHIAVKCRGG